jgi:hypothetical protein
MLGTCPPSLRFLGRKVYLAAMVVLIAIMREGATAARMLQLSALVGVNRRTVERWRTWWRDSFTATPFWQVARAAFMPPVDLGRLPAALIERFAGDAADRLVALLRFIAPITGGKGTLDNGFPRSAEDARRQSSGLDLRSVRRDPEERRRDTTGTRSASRICASP